MATRTSTAFGGQSMVAPLRRVLVCPPRASDCRDWQDYGWRSEPDPERLAAEHAAICAELEAAGAEVIRAGAADAGLDAIYARDSALVTDDGAVLLRAGKPERRREAVPTAAALEEAGVPIVAALEAPATAEGGDLVWLDERTLLVGRGYRTNPAGVDALRATLAGVDVLAFDLPHFRGPADVLHLMSFISLLDRDLAVVYPPLVPARLMQLLHDRETELVEIAEDEYDTMATNVLALTPRVALAVDGNPKTRRRLEAAGVEVRVYAGEELGKGDGGPTCLTRPLLRA